MLACLALAAASPAPAAAPIKYFPAATVDAAFAKGTPLLENDAYKIHATRREQPGMVEVHTRDTDIIHVLQGSATFVTGGTMVDGKTIAPDELRGRTIEGGETREINQAVRRWLDGPKVVERPAEPQPGKRGDRTVVDIHGVADAEEHLKRVQEWARSTWDAWSAHHDLARQWIDRATRESPKR